MIKLLKMEEDQIVTKLLKYLKRIGGLTAEMHLNFLAGISGVNNRIFALPFVQNERSDFIFPKKERKEKRLLCRISDWRTGTISYSLYLARFTIKTSDWFFSNQCIGFIFNFGFLEIRILVFGS